MEVYMQKGSELRKVNWFSSLPEKFCREIMQKVRETASSQGDLKINNDYRVVLKMDSPRSKMKKLFRRPGKRQVSPKPKEDLGIGVSNLPSTRLHSLQIPSVPPPKFRQHLQLFSRDGTKVRLVSLVPSATNIKRSSIMAPNFQRNENKELLNFPSEFFENQKRIGSSYSVKYVGITEGRIGILSRRMPMESGERADHKMVKSSNYFYPTIGSSRETYTQDLKRKKMTPEPTENNRQAAEVETLRFKEQGGVPKFAPIGNASLNEVYGSKYYNTKYNAEENFSQESKSLQITPGLYQKAGQMNLPKVSTKQVAEGLSEDNKQQNNQEKTRNYKLSSSDIQPYHLKGPGTIPEPWKYNEHLVHTYSFPKALVTQKKLKVNSEAETVYENKYSKEEVVSATFSKLYGFKSSKLKGFIGNGATGKFRRNWVNKPRVNIPHSSPQQARGLIKNFTTANFPSELKNKPPMNNLMIKEKSLGLGKVTTQRNTIEHKKNTSPRFVAQESQKSSPSLSQPILNPAVNQLVAIQILGDIPHKII